MSEDSLNRIGSFLKDDHSFFYKIRNGELKADHVTHHGIRISGKIQNGEIIICALYLVNSSFPHEKLRKRIAQINSLPEICKQKIQIGMFIKKGNEYIRYTAHIASEEDLETRISGMIFCIMTYPPQRLSELIQK